MKRIISVAIAALITTSCAVQPEQARVQDADRLAKAEPEIAIQDELLNEPSDNPRFVIARPPAVDDVEQAITESIKRHLVRLGYVEVTSRDDANVVIWHNYESKQTGLRVVGQPTDVWGEQSLPLKVTDLSTVMPASFAVQIISLQESRFPGQVIPIWQGKWFSSVPGINLLEFSGESLAKVFDRYLSEQTQSQIAAFRQARKRQLKAAINTYMKMVMYRIQSNWRKPKYNVKGKKCEVKIVQSAVGEIKSHKLLACDKDRRFRRSIEKAIRESSPLPLPKQELFDRGELILIFQG